VLPSVNGPMNYIKSHSLRKPLNFFVLCRVHFSNFVCFRYESVVSCIRKLHTKLNFQLRYEWLTSSPAHERPGTSKTIPKILMTFKQGFIFYAVKMTVHISIFDTNSSYVLYKG
jgi:hypothetical protein